MTHIAVKALLAAALGLGSLAGAPAVAMADGIYFGLDMGGPRYVPGPPPGDRDWHDRDRHDRDRRDYDRRDYDRRDRERFTGFGCSEREAVRKAWNMGLNHPRVVRVTPGRVVVEGERHRRTMAIAFGNFPGCPAY